MDLGQHFTQFDFVVLVVVSHGKAINEQGR